MSFSKYGKTIERLGVQELDSSYLNTFTCAGLVNTCIVCSQSLDVIKEIIITATVSPIHGQRHFHQKLFTHCSSLHAIPAKHVRPGSECIPAHPGSMRNLIGASKQLSFCQYGIQNRNMPKRRGESAVPAPNALPTVHESQ